MQQRQNHKGLYQAEAEQRRIRTPRWRKVPSRRDKPNKCLWFTYYSITEQICKSIGCRYKIVYFTEHPPAHFHIQTRWASGTGVKQYLQSLKEPWFFNTRKTSRLRRGKQCFKTSSMKGNLFVQRSQGLSFPHVAVIPTQAMGNPSTTQQGVWHLWQRCTDKMSSELQSQLRWSVTALMVVSMRTEPYFPYVCSYRELCHFVHMFPYIAPRRHANSGIFMGLLHFSEADEVNKS